MIYVGIDGGLKGGMTIIDDDGEILLCKALPLIGKDYDLKKIGFYIFQFGKENIKVLFEDAGCRPMNGPKQNFKIGEMFGQIKGFLHTCELSYQTIRPQKWQKEIFNGMTVKDTKIASAEWCSRKYPNFDFRASERCRKLHDGMTDACCIANYCRKNW